MLRNFTKIEWSGVHVCVDGFRRSHYSRIALTLLFNLVPVARLYLLHSLSYLRLSVLHLPAMCCFVDILRNFTQIESSAVHVCVGRFRGNTYSRLPYTLIFSVLQTKIT